MVFADTPDALAASPIFMAKLLSAADEGYERFLLRGRSRYQRVSRLLEFEGTTADRDFRVRFRIVGSHTWMQWRTETVEPIRMTLCLHCTLCPRSRDHR